MPSHSTFRLLKGWTEIALDWLEWSQVAAVLGAGMIAWAMVRLWRLPPDERLPAGRRGAAGAALGFVGLALLATVVGIGVNLALMHIGGQDHVRHFHARLVRQATMIGAALGAGGGAVVGVLLRPRPRPGGAETAR